MGIIDKVTSLLPWRGGRQEPPHRADAFALRDDLDRWFERVMGERWGAAALGALRQTPPVDVRETDNELIVTAEVPGLDRDDIELTITPEGLTIRGEKREESEDRRKDGVVAQTRYALCPERAAAPGARRRPGGGACQERRADRPLPEGGRTARRAPHSNRDMIRRRALNGRTALRPGRTAWRR
jgi:HSP20 family molecular chaperone IbpA